MIPGFNRSHSGYQQLDVPLPAAEERLYPSLDERDHRVLPPPSDVPVSIAAPQLLPSAPVFGMNAHAPQQHFAVSSASQMPLPPSAVMQYQAPNAQGYVALSDNSVNGMSYQPGMPLPPPVSEPFISDSVTPTPTVEEVTDKIKNSTRADFQIQAMFGHSWRFYGKNFCNYCGTQILLLAIFMALLIVMHIIAWAIVPDGYDRHTARKKFIWLYLAIFGLVALFVYPLFLALSFATLRAIQTNRFLMLGEFLKFFSQHYCNFFFFSALGSLLIFPFFGVFSLIGLFLYFFLFSFAALLKFQYPQMRTCKAMYLSARISLKNWPKMLLLSFLLIIFNILSFLVFGIFLFISIPVTMAVNVYIYHKLVGLHSVAGYNNMIARVDSAYDGTGANVDQTVRHLQQVQVQQPQPQMALQPAQRVQYVQLVPVMRVPGVLPPPVVSSGAPGGPVVVVRSSAV